MSIITVNNLSKRYRIGQRGRGWDSGLRHALTDMVTRPFRRGAKAEEDETEFWALKDVSFEVEEGEVLGIIGRNGAGKSTLLKILSRITWPTSGEVRIRGRVASLLEVGTGFHPELTGRENIYLNGSILGMTRAEVKRKFDEIVDFSEIEKFLDTPVKRYSSGMYVRLAFAVAAHLDPEILLVDEVLAVGDAGFQKKCLGKIGDVAKGGRTVLFVSHNMTAIQSLCRRTIWLNESMLMDDGSATSIILRYMESTALSKKAQSWDDENMAPGNEYLKLRNVRVVAETDCPSEILTMATPFVIETEYKVLKADTVLHITYHLINEKGLVVLTSGQGPRLHKAGDFKAVCHMPGNLLNSGKYSVNIFFLKDNSQFLSRIDGIVSFDVMDAKERDIGFMTREPGIVQPLLTWDWIKKS